MGLLRRAQRARRAHLGARRWTCEAEILRSGYPRNDPLVQLRSPEQRAAVRAELGLPADDDARALCARRSARPTSRACRTSSCRSTWTSCSRSCPTTGCSCARTTCSGCELPAATTPPCGRVARPDITPLLVAADVLVTDYSSVMFDFANTGRPMVFFVYDYDDYAHSERGVYWELAGARRRVRWCERVTS